jgi:hypothetical protein
LARTANSLIRFLKVMADPPKEAIEIVLAFAWPHGQVMMDGVTGDCGNL